MDTTQSTIRWYGSLLIYILIAVIACDQYPNKGQIAHSAKLKKAQINRTSLTNQKRLPTRIHGISLSLHGEFPELNLGYSDWLREIRKAGASHVSIVVQANQRMSEDTVLTRVGEGTTSDTTLRRVIGLAHQEGLSVFLLPIIWLEQRTLGTWRGTLQPRNRVDWWQSYRNFILHYAKFARDHKVSMFSIGSELGSMEKDVQQWRALIRDIRLLYDGILTYSANWDHFADIEFWNDLDAVGVTGYFELCNPPQCTVDTMIDRWTLIKGGVLDWYQDQRRPPLIFTELGYPSHPMGAAQPWNYYDGAPPDSVASYHAYRAFSQVWKDEPRLRGVFFWNAWGLGGAFDSWYTLRGKDIIVEVQRFFQNQ